MLILVDLDKTLIDERYQVTDSGIFQEIERVQKAGHLIGLSSDSSFQTLQPWYKRFGMSGPILAERGSAFQLTGEIPCATGSSDELIFLAMREYFAEELGSRGFEVIDCDPSWAIKEGVFERAESKLALINSFRRWSFHVSFRREQKTSVDLALSILDGACAKFGWSMEDFFIDPSLEYCLLIVHSKKSQKSYGTQALMVNMGLESLVVIGDGENDYTGLPGVSHWAVGNARLEYKEKCEKVANAGYTQGVVELLRSL